MQKIKLKTEESGKKLLAAYAPPKWSETADDDDDEVINDRQADKIYIEFAFMNISQLSFLFSGVIVLI